MPLSSLGGAPVRPPSKYAPELRAFEWKPGLRMEQYYFDQHTADEAVGGGDIYCVSVHVENILSITKFDAHQW